MADDYKTIEFNDNDSWRNWLEDNHNLVDGVWMVVSKIFRTFLRGWWLIRFTRWLPASPSPASASYRDSSACPIWCRPPHGAVLRRFQAIARVDLLIIDDFGLKPLRPQQDEDLHDLIGERYERGATVITSNLEFAEWGEAFPNRLLGAATLDRLRHNAYRVVLDGDSYRAPRPMPNGAKPTVAKAPKSGNP